MVKDGEIGKEYEAFEKGFEYICKFCKKGKLKALFHTLSMSSRGVADDDEGISPFHLSRVYTDSM